MMSPAPDELRASLRHLLSVVEELAVAFMRFDADIRAFAREVLTETNHEDNADD